MSTVFTKIIKGDLPSYKIAEDENFYAFLDINPLKEGHTLVVPKMEQDKIYDLDDDTLRDFIVFAKRTSKAIEKSIPCLRVGMTVIGLEVPHAHIHLIPLNDINDMSFDQPKLVLEVEKMKSIQKCISQNFE
ncbi:MAG: HIT family protein [Flavobacteriales bacterium]|jgi:histidine triad (HIT) family protein|nr:HIT family protein [Flavobacteriales bacterium]MDC0302123.1 HIT family protein [bacterium]